MDRAQIRTRVEGTSNIATIPDIVAKLRRTMDSRSASAMAVGEEIAKDQVLAAKVLRLVNSGFYGFRTPITTITQAMVLLGFDVVKTLVLSAAVLDILELMNQYLAGLWEHSLATARAANWIADRMGLRNPEEVAVAGLLHDLGKVIIAQRFPNENKEIRALAESGAGRLQLDAERTVLGVTHPEVGMWLLRKWGLPDKLLYPIGYHHAFHSSRDVADRTAIIHVADIIARGAGIGYSGDNGIPAINPDAWSMLKITMSDVDEIYQQLEGEF